jgi:sugar transferase (PEP-CTERM/EpsH1 system associated)
MTDLLFLAHRIPYPPNKGDKVRSYHLLKHLAERYRVYLGAFVDDPSDWDQAEKLQELCAQSCLIALNPIHARLRGLAGLLGGEPITLPFYRDAAMARWVEKILAHRSIERIAVYSSAVGQYVPSQLRNGTRVVVDFVDVDSDKWRQYAATRRWPASWVYRREARELLAWERRLAARADVSAFVSGAEAALFRRLAPEVADKVTHVNNGVDLDYFSASREYPCPYPSGIEPVVFTGAMDYWANVEAVEWFAREVFPAIQARRPTAWFYVVGARPRPEVQRLGALAGVRVTGTVDDVRPYLAHARVSVAPLRIARGVQNKILEAMAMARPVIATGLALEGIEPSPTPGTMSVDDARAMADQVLWCLREPAAAIALGTAGRASVVEHYDWTRNLDRFTALLDEEEPHRRDGAKVKKINEPPDSLVRCG